MATVVMAALGAAGGPLSADECMPAPVKRAYRVEPEEAAVATAALIHHFQARPEATPRCIALPGYSPLPPPMAEDLKAAGVILSRETGCRFIGGQSVWSVGGVWRLPNDRFEVHITNILFGHISRFVEGHIYTMRSRDGAWVVESARPSTCNKRSKPAEAPS